MAGHLKRSLQKHVETRKEGTKIRKETTEWIEVLNEIESSVRIILSYISRQEKRSVKPNISKNWKTCKEYIKNCRKV